MAEFGILYESFVLVSTVCLIDYADMLTCTSHNTHTVCICMYVH